MGKHEILYEFPVFGIGADVILMWWIMNPHLRQNDDGLRFEFNCDEYHAARRTTNSTSKDWVGYSILPEQKLDSRPDWTGTRQNRLVRVLGQVAFFVSPGPFFFKDREASHCGITFGADGCPFKHPRLALSENRTHTASSGTHTECSNALSTCLFSARPVILYRAF